MPDVFKTCPVCDGYLVLHSLDDALACLDAIVTDVPGIGLVVPFPPCDSDTP